MLGNQALFTSAGGTGSSLIINMPNIVATAAPTFTPVGLLTLTTAAITTAFALLSSVAIAYVGMKIDPNMETVIFIMNASWTCLLGAVDVYDHFKNSQYIGGSLTTPVVIVAKWLNIYLVQNIIGHTLFSNWSEESEGQDNAMHFIHHKNCAVEDIIVDGVCIASEYELDCTNDNSENEIESSAHQEVERTERVGMQHGFCAIEYSASYLFGEQDISA